MKEKNVDVVRKTAYDDMWHIVQGEKYCRVDQKTALRVARTMYYDNSFEKWKKSLRKNND